VFFELSHQLIDKLYRLDTEASEGLQDEGNELAILLRSQRLVLRNLSRFASFGCMERGKSTRLTVRGSCRVSDTGINEETRVRK